MHCKVSAAELGVNQFQSGENMIDSLCDKNGEFDVWGFLTYQIILISHYDDATNTATVQLEVSTCDQLL